MRRFVLTLVAATILLALPTQTQAQLQAGPYVAFHDDQDLGFGAFIGVPFSSVDEDLFFTSDLGIFFPDDGGSRHDRDYLELNADLLYRIPAPDLEFTPWVKGGLNLARCSYSLDSEGPGRDSHTDTELGLNIGGGVTFGSGSTRPFVGVKFELGGGEGGVLYGGVTFRVGEGS
jgi:hypothetical protein